MYVCSCNALTDVQMRRAIAQHGADRPAAVFAACNCRAQCGTCVRSVCALLGLGRSCGQTEGMSANVQAAEMEVRHAA